MKRFLCSVILVATLFSGTVCAGESARVIEGLVGKQPAKICWLIQRLKREELGEVGIKNRFIFYGPPGNGKTTLVHKIAALTDSELMALDGPSIVESYVGRGARNIKNFFADVQERVEKTGKRVIAFIDEIDAIAANNKTEFRSEHESALQQLWLELDKCKHNQQVFVFFATNHFKKLSKTFLDRFGGNVIEIANPDRQTRRQVLEHYFSKAHIPLESGLLDELVKKTDSLSIRCLEDFAGDVKMAVDIESASTATPALVWETLHVIRKKFEHHVSDEERDTRLQKVSTYVAIVSGVLASYMNLRYLLLGSPSVPGISCPRGERSSGYGSSKFCGCSACVGDF